MRRAKVVPGGTIAAGLGVAAALALALSAAAGESYELSEVLANVRAALGTVEGADDESGLILSGQGTFDGMDLTMRFALDGAGRFVLDGRGPISAAKGHDGSITWDQQPTGDVRHLRLGDRYRILLPNWAIGGYWLAPEAGLEPSVNKRKSTKAQVALELRVQGTDFSGIMSIDSATWLPLSFTVRDMGREFSLRFESFQKYGSRMLPEHMEAFDNDRRTGELHFEEVTRVTEFPSGYFSPPEDAVEVRYIEGAAAELEVRRGRWGHLFVKPLINGTDVGWFAFDTGASNTTLDRKAAAWLELPVLGESRSTGIGGQAKAEIRSIDWIQVGPIRLDSIPVSTGAISSLGLGLSGGHIGLLGMDVLGHCVIVYDLARSRISLHNPSEYELPSGDWSPLLEYNGKPTVRMAFEDHTGLFTIDTGNIGAIIFGPHTTERLDLLDGRKTRSGTVGGIDGSVSARDGALEWVEWGGRRFHDVPAQFVSTKRGASADRFRDGIIGTDLVERLVVVFDMSNGRIAFLPRT